MKPRKVAKKAQQKPPSKGAKTVTLARKVPTKVQAQPTLVAHDTIDESRMSLLEGLQMRVANEKANKSSKDRIVKLCDNSKQDSAPVAGSSRLTRDTRSAVMFSSSDTKKPDRVGSGIPSKRSVQSTRSVTTAAKSKKSPSLTPTEYAKYLMDQRAENGPPVKGKLKGITIFLIHRDLSTATPTTRDHLERVSPAYEYFG